jgi:hypothetical protein
MNYHLPCVTLYRDRSTDLARAHELTTRAHASFEIAAWSGSPGASSATQARRIRQSSRDPLDAIAPDLALKLLQRHKPGVMVGTARFLRGVVQVAFIINALQA